MIDLGKPLGTHQGIVFYGDHENDKIVYYLPDEIKFAPTPSGKLDLHLQMFKDESSTTGSAAELTKTGLHSRTGGDLRGGFVTVAKSDRVCESRPQSSGRGVRHDPSLDGRFR